MRAPKRSDNGGYASGLERENAKVLEASGLEFWYEDGPCIVEYIMPIRNGECNDCKSGKVHSKHKYTADFAFRSKSGKLILVETKGHPLSWTGATRAKHQSIKKQFPEMDLRFVFCGLHKSVSKLIPRSWLNE